MHFGKCTVLMKRSKRNTDPKENRHIYCKVQTRDDFGDIINRHNKNR